MRGGALDRRRRRVATLDGLVAERGAQGFLRVDNAPEFVAGSVASWASELGVTSWFTDPGSLWR
ncbi:transposase family protein [Acidimicrobium ferrooxidans]|uniref:transposase family protein n=1 Tax=Acidimicrobium ferrooxidans TaxID=53635 RepID=UPI00019DE45C|nr:transposase family protein [Acidimicrobium ferrooxidans]